MNDKKLMWKLLKQMKANGGSIRLLKTLSFSDKDQLRRMLYAGLVTYDLTTHCYTMTEAGEAVLKLWEAGDAAGG